MGGGDILVGSARTQRVEKLSAIESERYFRSRPRGSQISALTSQQSRPIASREALDARLAENARRYAESEVPRPPDWGGYRLIPDTVEFWQGRDNRCHDRLVYRRHAGRWRIERLQP